MSDSPYSYWPPPRDWQDEPASPAPPPLAAWKIGLAMLGIIGLLLVPAFVWAAGLGLDGGTLGDWLIFYAFMLAIPLGASLALLAPAMTVSRECRVCVAFVLLAFVVPVSVLAAWPVGSSLIVVEVGAVPAALGLFFLASGLRQPGVPFGSSSLSP